MHDRHNRSYAIARRTGCAGRIIQLFTSVYLPPRASCTEAGALTIRLPLKYLMLAVPPLSRQTSGRTVLVISATSSSPFSVLVLLVSFWRWPPPPPPCWPNSPPWPPPPPPPFRP